MKKVLSILPLLLAATLTLTACGQKAPASSTPASSTPASSTPASSAPASSAPAAPKFDTSKNISVTAREDGSGTKTAFMELIGLKGKADPANVVIQTGTAGVLAEVKGNPSAIAYESLGYVTPDVKMIKVDNVEATIDNIKNGSYKISRPLSVVYKEASLGDAVNKAFFTYLQSSDAQKIIAEHGYVTMNDGAAAYTADGALSGSIDISGSTSLQPLMIELAAAFEKLQDKVKINVSGGGSGTGYKNGEEGVSAFGMISEEFNKEKAASCTHYVVCKDGIAVIVNKDNPIESISMDELKNIYNAEATTATAKWSELIK